jgi:uncharacterized protein (DUF885 family)
MSDLRSQYGDDNPNEPLAVAVKSATMETAGHWHTITLENGTRFEVPVRAIFQNLYDENRKLHDMIRRMQQDHREMQGQHQRLITQMRQMQSRFDAS